VGSESVIHGRVTAPKMTQSDSAFQFSNDDMDLDMCSPSFSRVPHRRVRSDPTDLMPALRAARTGWTPEQEAVMGQMKRDLSPFRSSSATYSPALKKHAPTLERRISDCSMSTETTPAEVGGTHGQMNFHIDANNFSVDPSEADSRPGTPPMRISKKDVPMWTVEEDLLILQLVDQHGKRWSKIASHLPGRTDNGVRNRWNRMERAQVLRQRRGTEAGYRCRRCGQPKRGHICAALTMGDRPEGEELQQKAEALTKLSAQAIRTTLVEPMSQSQPSSQIYPEPQSKFTPQVQPNESLQQQEHVQPVPPVKMSQLPVPPAMQFPQPNAQESAPLRGNIFSTSQYAKEPALESIPSAAFDDAQLDEFLEELRVSLTSQDSRDETVAFWTQPYLQFEHQQSSPSTSVLTVAASVC